MANSFDFDVFLSHSSKDKPTVRKLAKRLKADGVRVWFDEWEIKPGDSIPAKVEEGLEQSRILVLCMSANAFGSDWAALESYTFRFRDPLNKERRFLPLRLDDAEIKGSLAQFLYIDWRAKPEEPAYAKLVDACRPPVSGPPISLVQQPFVSKIWLVGHTDSVWGVAWSRDGRQALSASSDNTLRLWDVASSRLLGGLEGHTNIVWSVAWSPDGEHALSASDDKTLRLWHVASRRCLGILKGHTSGVNDVAWSRDGKHALSAAGDSTLRLWDMANIRCVGDMKGHSSGINSVTWSPNGKQALSASFDNTLRLWDVASGRSISIFKGHTSGVLDVAWSPDGKQALSASSDNTLRLWEVASGRCRGILEGHTRSIMNVAWSPDGKEVLTASDDHTLRLWDVEKGRSISVLEGHKDSVNSVAWSPDGKQALSASSDNTLRLWEVATARTIQVLEGHMGSINNVTWSPDGKHALSTSYDKTLRVWEMSSGRSRSIFKGHTSGVLNVAWSPDGKQALSGSDDKMLRLWDVATARTLQILEGHKDTITSIAWSPDGKLALSGSDDKTLRVWRTADGHMLRVLEGHTDTVWSVAWNPNGDQVLSGSGDKTLRLWDVVTGRSLRVLKGHTSSVMSVAWSPDGKQALSGSADKTMRLWDITTGRILRVFEGHTSSVRSVVWSFNGKHALSGSEDTTLRLWDVATGRTLSVLRGHDDPVWNVDWGSNDNQAFSSGADGVIHIWQLGAMSKIEDGKDQAKNKESHNPPTYSLYTNAKVLLVGESGVGKTGLANYLALGKKDEERNSSTDGAWATQWKLPHSKQENEVELEIWLWDFAGQVDYRLVHQLYMEDTAAALLVFNPQKENPFDELGQWDRDLQKSSRKPFAKLLVAGRVDRGGLVVSNQSIERFMQQRGFVSPLHLTSAKTGEGCEALRDAIMAAIDWQNIPSTASPTLYQRLKQEILHLRDSGLVLIRLAELKQRLELLLGDQPFKLEELETVIGLLAGPGMIQRLDFGNFILLRPEVLSRYASAVVRKVRKHPQELGCIREDEFLAGDLDYQDFQRLPTDDEVVVLRALHETVVSRAWCLRQPAGSSFMLTFPSYFRRQRPELVAHPSVLVTYRFNGSADEIYATLVVRLHHTEAFESDQLWKDAADFKTQTDQNLGFKLIREGEGTSRLEVYFSPAVDENSRVLFLRYVHNHLHETAQEVRRLRHYFCSNKKCDDFGKPFPNQEKIDKALAAGGNGKVFCPECGKSISLRDTLEQKFDSPEFKEQVRQLQIGSQQVIDKESLELILIGHAFTTAAEAGQIFRQISNSEYGIDGEIEFVDDQGNATGKRIYLQLKSRGDQLPPQRRTGLDVFEIDTPHWINYWQQQPYPVMLVNRSGENEIQWMDLREYLQQVTGKSQRDVPLIVFKGERFDVMSVRRWRDRVLGLGLSK